MRHIFYCVLLVFCLGLFFACGSGENTPPPPYTAPESITGIGILTWNPVVQDSTGGPVLDLAGYKVYRSTVPDQWIVGDPTQILATIDATSATYTDTTGLRGTTYYYVVTAYDLSGNESGVSNQVFATY